MSEPRRTAVVITTFDHETVAVTAHFREAPRERRYREARGTLYEIGTVGDWDVAVAEIGPGNTTAGLELERAATEFAPRAILLVGVAGGLKDLGLGDVVAADAVYDYEAGKDTDDGLLPRIKTHSSAPRLLQHARLVARHGTWVEGIRGTPPAVAPRAVVKPVAAGGKLVAGNRSATAAHLRRYCGDAVAVEMEGHGFLRGAYLNHAAEALVVRGVSDLLGDKTQAHDVQWQPVAARHAAAFAYAVLDSAGRSLESAPRPRADGEGRHGITIDNARGVQIGDGNTQWNTFG
jgi:adenosylhomocysteine nucleosidase